ncbi:MAG: type II toxin-antitoxin system death-on-curing family toxin [Weissella hellenica]|uniref:type II toxin-antitoxin system death-on-curing family toxin n=1 Tax=Weissella hellenica TaxID=46256 RepID=UPI003F9A4313
MTQYFQINHALETHNLIIKKSGGMQGIKDIGLLESVLSFIQNNDYYPTFEEKIGHLVFAVAKNHAFLDGNKRSSIALGSLFLKINGYPDFIVDNFMEKMETVVLVTVINKITKEDLIEIIALIINDLPYTDEINIKLATAVSYYNDNYTDE